MRLGAVFPTNEIDASDPAQFRDWVRGVEALGYDHMVAIDHVLGADPNRPGGWSGPYTMRHRFHEPLTLLAFAAALTTRLELATGVLILPQRQTALVAKQAAEIDVLSGGRLRLAVGSGWNALEYEALNEDFSNRGRRMEEQVEVMRALWTQPRVDIKGRWHTIDAAGINPLPVQRPIPIWFGGEAERAVKRAARIGDGWMPSRLRGATVLTGIDVTDETRARIDEVKGYVREAGRDPAAFGVEGRVTAPQGGPDDWVAAARGWQEAGATHLSFRTMDAGYRTVDEHLDALRRFREGLLPTTV